MLLRHSTRKGDPGITEEALLAGGKAIGGILQSAFVFDKDAVKNTTLVNFLVGVGSEAGADGGKGGHDEGRGSEDGPEGAGKNE